jgi:hypothetical protein
MAGKLHRGVGLHNAYTRGNIPIKITKAYTEGFMGTAPATSPYDPAIRQHFDRGTAEWQLGYDPGFIGPFTPYQAPPPEPEE